MTVNGYSLSVTTLIVACAASLWLLTILFGSISWERRRVRGGFRKTDLVALIATLAFATVWLYTFGRTATVTPETKKTTSCTLVNAGDRESIVKERLGEPDDIVGEEETRGPASNVWIYRDSRCAVHFYGDTVESVD